MKNLLKSSLALVLLLAASTVACHAQVPEIDPSTGAGSLALLGGMVMVMRGRRKR